MLKVHLVALSDGQSYNDVTIIDNNDYEAHNVPDLMEENTFAFVYDKKLILTHRYSVKLIIYSREKPTNIPNCIPFKKVKVQKWIPSFLDNQMNKVKYNQIYSNLHLN